MCGTFTSGFWEEERCGERVLWVKGLSDRGAPTGYRWLGENTGEEAQGGFGEAIRDGVSRGLWWRVLGSCWQWGCVCACVRMHVHACEYVCTCMCAYVSAHTCVCMHACACVCVYVY